MRNQLKITFQIGFPFSQKDKAKQYEGDLAAEASYICGGCTTSLKDGWWRADGDVKKDTFCGSLERELCLELELTCETHKAETAYLHMVHAITEASRFHGIETDWVHVTETVMAGRHFSVKDNMKALAA